MTTTKNLCYINHSSINANSCWIWNPVQMFWILTEFIPLLLALRKALLFSENNRTVQVGHISPENSGQYSYSFTFFSVPSIQDGLQRGDLVEKKITLLHLDRLGRISLSEKLSSDEDDLLQPAWHSEHNQPEKFWRHCSDLWLALRLWYSVCLSEW